MSNVLIHYGSINPTSVYDNKSISEAVKYFGGETRSKMTAQLTVEDLEWCDILVDIRPDNRFDRYSRAIKKTGRKYIVFLDDDLLHYSGRYIGRDYGIKKCLSRADALWGCNPDLLDEYCNAFNIPQKALQDTYFEERELIAPQPASKPIKIVFAAGANHEGPFEQYVEPALNKLALQYGSVFSLTFIGVKPTVSDYLKNTIDVNYVDGMPFDEFRAYMSENQFNVGLAPLKDELFCQRKYYNKFFEYSRTGIATLFSNCKPYTFIVENWKNGVLVDNTVESWFNALEKIINNEFLVWNIAKSAQNDIRLNYNKEKVLEKIHNHLPDFSEEHSFSYDRIRSCPNSILGSAAILCSQINGYIIYYRRHGFLGFIKGVVWHMKGKLGTRRE